MNKVVLFLVLSLSAAILSGCWDQQLLKDVRIIFALGIDVSNKGESRGIVSVLDVKKTESGTKEESETHSVVSKTLRDGRDILNQETSGILAPNKLNVLLLGEKLARQGIYPAMNIYYRDTRTAINARTCIVRGTAQEVVEMNKVGTKLVGEHIYQQLNALEDVTIVPKEFIQTFFPVMLDPGQDMALPYVQKKEDKVFVRGLALFDGDRMIGELNKNESILYLLLQGKKAKTARFTLNAHDTNKPNIADYISIDIKRVKRTFKVMVDEDQKITVHLALQLPVIASEYPLDHLKDKRVVDQLNEKLSNELTQRAKMVIQKFRWSIMIVLAWDGTLLLITRILGSG
ncbi:Ger(x)C family spore germination protein [Brevibacillus fluminis]|uniref:Ger(X)C family spore germination protein n=1 Tax=Brevibacillus fluminis TaxID=511487 RepID=A0A3M8CYQ9_9BACL|nr:Ger(x)C family spore germination protein [Brevibacillus fluminis]RNB80992.1 Ger(x)C family spore germination protein [Brevibacillus fluminis]